jgi:hypothetical protein
LPTGLIYSSRKIALIPGFQMGRYEVLAKNPPVVNDSHPSHQALGKTLHESYVQ